jgi:ABC-type branched-subunit amino acid transport system ATPase component
MATIVDISHVDFAYGQQPVLKHVNLQIEAGTTLGLIGPKWRGQDDADAIDAGACTGRRRGAITVAGG